MLIHMINLLRVLLCVRCGLSVDVLYVAQIQGVICPIYIYNSGILLDVVVVFSHAVFFFLKEEIIIVAELSILRRLLLPIYYYFEEIIVVDLLF